MNPTLVIMAAGLGRRFQDKNTAARDGAKQVAAVGPNGELLMEYSVYDAWLAGFASAVFILRADMVEDFKQSYGDRMAKYIDVKYVVQDSGNLPDEHEPVRRQNDKPWGTGHALLCCLGTVDAPFCVITADDFYGRESFDLAYKYLSAMVDASRGDGCLIGFRAKDTMSQNGTVSRACVDVDGDGYIRRLTERTKLQIVDGKLMDLNTGEALSADTTVSCTMFGLHPAFLPALHEQFGAFLRKHKADLSGVEFYLPTAIDEQIQAGRLRVPVIETGSKWFGMTHAADKEGVMARLEDFTARGIYPSPLFPPNHR